MHEIVGVVVGLADLFEDHSLHLHVGGVEVGERTTSPRRSTPREAGIERMRVEARVPWS
jgi:hypothetical protein